jgi:DNA-binding transcriptional LysR family regulator
MSARPDLNLLVALHALLEEQHVTRAAARIGVSQPAASTMLARLRRHFDDELIERVGNRYELTPLGAQLRAQSAGVLHLTEQLFYATAGFDPSTTEREFVLAASDYATVVLGPGLVAALASQAPQAALRFIQLSELSETQQAGTPTVDGLIAPRGSYHLDELPSLDLFSDEWVALVDHTNPVADGWPDPSRWKDLPWALAEPTSNESLFMARRLVENGLRLRPRAITTGYLALPSLVAGTDRIAIAQRRLATVVPLPSGVRVVPCPFVTGPINEALWWHPVHTHDAGHKWFRRLVTDTAQLLDPH